jgi:hypothetical protein
MSRTNERRTDIHVIAPPDHGAESAGFTRKAILSGKSFKPVEALAADLAMQDVQVEGLINDSNDTDGASA